MHVNEIYERVLNIYLEHREKNPSFTFCPNIIKGKKLMAGYWFQGNSECIFSTPFVAGDSLNKTKTIGFVLEIENGKVVGQSKCVVFGSSDNLKEIDFYKHILSICDIEYIEAQTYYTNVLEGSWEDNLANFLLNDVPKMKVLIEDYDFESEFILPEHMFERYYKNILEVKRNGVVSLGKQ